ncbi:hypothetical protein [Novosphingobium sp.]|uniref:hypothetical protein n=1 Tax=Novosphingobium sp. TaxID=1874826 RepID=UPI0038BCB123
MDDRPIEPNDPPPLPHDEPTGPEPIVPAPISPEVPSETEAPRAIAPDVLEAVAPPTDPDDPGFDNSVQDDEGEQAQTLAEEARYGGLVHDPVTDSERVPGGIDDDDDGGTPDLVDHMNQMVTSGRIDMDAFRGERNDDDADWALGEAGEEDEGPRGAP